MGKRLFDLSAALIALMLTAPLLVLTAIGVRVASPGPVLHRALRVGRGGAEFVMYKFRTMHVASADQSAITAADDRRVFPLGRVLRSSKIDELPQLWNVVAGHMSIVGPRPEHPRIVERHYGPLGMDTLSVRPGLASPGSLFNYTHGQRMLDDQDPEAVYVESLLPLKLALELVYVRNRSALYDLRIVLTTVLTIARMVGGGRDLSEPREMAEARRILSESAAQLVNRD